MKTILFLAFITLGCLLAEPAQAAPTDAEIKKSLLGFWRSPRHEYEYKPNGKIYMLPMAPDTTTNTWAVKGGLFYQDNEPFVIVTLNDKKFVYKSKSDGVSFTLIRITAKMVGQPYNRESVR